ncbi:MAG: MerR family transcriptional regulator, partial [Verrucomicrobiales bacterium]|nr:MerR family transcriptional regulator [Verrucomicrobiales bacterium]
MTISGETSSQSEPEFFEISAVARLTGISSHVLRVWERRYQVVEPNRSESKRRQYTEKDIQRLSLLKALVDNGHSIG